MINVYIGYDQVEAVAYHTLCHSIIARASVPVRITPVKRSLLKGVHTRALDPKQSNEFSYTRFLVPWMNDYTGFAVFMDCDMLCRGDIAELVDAMPWDAAVGVVKHSYEPSTRIKYLGNAQYPYLKKNWSSVMVFNCQNQRTRRLTPEYVNEASGLDLHQFKWVGDDELIAALPVEWNHLVGEYSPNPNAKLVHYTIGGPWFHEYEDCEFSEEWFDERARMIHCEQYGGFNAKTAAIE